ncbi:MAG: hypothetical protein ACPGVU_25330, partial [Limisphaerales bacterium]
MSAHGQNTDPNSDWKGIRRGVRRAPGEWVAEKLIFLVSLSAIVLVFLIFAFVLREALPIFFGQMDSSVAQKVIDPKDMGTLSKEELQEYLELTDDEFADMDEETLQLMMEIKVEAAAEAPEDKD